MHSYVIAIAIMQVQTPSSDEANAWVQTISAFQFRLFCVHTITSIFHTPSYPRVCCGKLGKFLCGPIMYMPTRHGQSILRPAKSEVLDELVVGDFIISVKPDYL